MSYWGYGKRRRRDNDDYFVCSCGDECHFDESNRCPAAVVETSSALTVLVLSAIFAKTESAGDTMFSQRTSASPVFPILAATLAETTSPSARVACRNTSKHAPRSQGQSESSHLQPMKSRSLRRIFAKCEQKLSPNKHDFGGWKQDWPLHRRESAKQRRKSLKREAQKRSRSNLC